MPEILEIPIEKEDDDPALKIRTVLEGVEMVILFEWNTREAKWHASFYDATEAPILVGIPLNINLELFVRFEIPELPPGKLILYDTSDKSLEAGIADLGKRCRLYYEESV